MATLGTRPCLASVEGVGMVGSAAALLLGRVTERETVIREKGEVSGFPSDTLLWSSRYRSCDSWLT